MNPTAMVTQRRAAGEVIAGRIAAMLRNGVPADRPLPRSEWTVGDAAAHLAFTTLGLAMMARGLAIPYGDGTREGLAEANEVALLGFSERDLEVLASELVTNTGMVFDEADVAPPDRVCPTPMGSVPVDGLVGYVLTHQAMHGSAIAAATGDPLPFDPEHLQFMWPFIRHVLHQIVVPERVAMLNAGFELRFTEDFGFGVSVEGGHLLVERQPSGPVDCEISGDPHTLFLVLVKLLSAEEALQQGTLHLRGPRAELGLQLMDLFNIP